ncbi:MULTISPECIES: SMEK domain-containing protein [Tenacibaculum]|uniref:SMEK domain-containing protein n=1 Tax=Tenacibaculum TaxID=104267 RepID=UPI000897B8E7|nr:SMEK domain-containing protein [Tenacibaculum sp. MAR_2010_89]SEE20805.1 NACHT domain-containing protein [Tenacibaculum sp. MAR_2010_89]
MNLPTLFNSLSTRFGLLKSKMKIENAVNDFGLQVLLENTAIEILNTVYGYKFINANKESLNFAAVDALDNENEIALQITSTFSKIKIISTINKYLKNDLHKNHKHLKFFFLKDVKSLNKGTINEISKLLETKGLSLNVKEDFIDYEAIYQKLYFDTPDIPKILKVIEIIDNVLGVLPINKISSFASLGISFENDEMENVHTLVSSLLKQGINIYITSKKLYDELKDHRFFDYLVLVKDVKSISHINHYLIIISNQYIQKNLIEEESCVLFKTLLHNNYKSKTLAFNPYINNLNRIKNKRFRVYNNLDTDKKNIQEFSENLVVNFMSSNTSQLKVDTENIKESLISIRKGFEHKILLENNQQKTILFYINKMDVKIIYIVLKNGFSTISTIAYVKGLSKKYPLKNINLLVPQNPNHKTRKVLDTFKDKIRIENVYYIGEFLFEETLNDINQLPILGIDDFVSPVIKHETNSIHLVDILHWIVEERSPSIGIIEAPGGIGKTTLVEKIHDELINKENEYKHLVLFIEANAFIESFKNTDFSDETEYDLYSIFKKCHSQGNSIDEQLFYNNFNYGNILMIIDGVDEIVSTITSFNLDSFLIKLSELGEKIGKGKILLTSRDLYVKDIQTFLNKINGNGNAIVVYNLMPFNKKLAEKYFSLNGVSPSKIKRGLSLLHEFVMEKEKGNEYVYPPFVLDVVLDFMNSEENFEVDSEMFNSNYLLSNHRLDFIIQQTFNREGIKKHEYGYDLSIDSQVAFFTLMAIEKMGRIREEEILEIVNQIDFISNSEKVAKGLRDHPFIRKQDDYYVFIYRFLASEFCVTGVFSLLKKEPFIEISNELIRVLAFEANYNSIIAKGIIDKVNLDNSFSKDNFYVFIRGLINDIKQNREELKFIDKKAISNLFLLLCEYYSNEEKYSNENFNHLIKVVFGDKEGSFISNFYLMDVPDNFTLLLNFSGLNLKNSEINNFNNFIFCGFNADTSFESSCEIKNINLHGVSLFDKLEEVSINEENFDNVVGDNSLHKILRLKELGKSGIEKEIRKYLKSFYIGKTLKDAIKLRELKNTYQNNDLMGKITKEMHKQNILLEIDNSELVINTKLKSKINKFVYQGRSFTEIREVFKGIAVSI